MDRPNYARPEVVQLAALAASGQCEAGSGVVGDCYDGTSPVSTGGPCLCSTGASVAEGFCCTGADVNRVCEL